MKKIKVLACALCMMMIFVIASGCASEDEYYEDFNIDDILEEAIAVADNIFNNDTSGDDIVFNDRSQYYFIINGNKYIAGMTIDEILLLGDFTPGVSSGDPWDPDDIVTGNRGLTLISEDFRSTSVTVQAGENIRLGDTRITEMSVSLDLANNLNSDIQLPFGLSTEMKFDDIGASISNDFGDLGHPFIQPDTVTGRGFSVANRSQTSGFTVRFSSDFDEQMHEMRWFNTFD